MALTRHNYAELSAQLSDAVSAAALLRDALDARNAEIASLRRSEASLKADLTKAEETIRQAFAEPQKTVEPLTYAPIYDVASWQRSQLLGGSK